MNNKLIFLDHVVGMMMLKELRWFFNEETEGPDFQNHIDSNLTRELKRDLQISANSVKALD